MSEYTPMMRQYLEVKKDYSDTLIMYRLGDFYELFFEDAKIASKELDLVLTGRNAGVEEKVPMCGVPHHAVNSYIQRLVNKGYKVGIVEQMEDPATAVGIVKREVIKIVTPGTIMDELNDSNSGTYIASLYDHQYGYTIIVCQIATGDLWAYKVDKEKDAIRQFVMNKSIKEIVVSAEDVQNKELMKTHVLVSTNKHDMPSEKYTNIYNNEDERIEKALNRLLAYLENTQKQTIKNLKPLIIIDEKSWLQMDYATKQNLELIIPSKAESNNKTLLSFMNHCRTSMGVRKLRSWIEYPLVSKEKIEDRLNVIDYLNHNFKQKNKLKEELSNMYDLDRIIGRIGYHTFNGKTCLHLQKVLESTPQVIQILNESGYKGERLDPHSFNDILNRVKDIIVSDPPISTKDGGIFVDGYNQQLDEYHLIQRNAKQWILDFENKEREKTGIKNLKIGYNRVFGYYIEISKGNATQVKDEWGYTRKQTLTNAERFVNNELKEQEDEILHAQEKAIRLESQLFEELVEDLSAYIVRLQKLAEILSIADAYYSLAVVSERKDYCRPTFDDHDLEIKDGRHPILEDYQKDIRYISNDVIMNKERNVLIITGPNMGGKSTYMRQTALITIMAQLGCYVPAKKAKLPIFDKLFTRIGASDDILSGQSTFMVEMNEANHALKNATANSFIIFDEIGRGTSTYDGMALAQAMLEYISTCIQAKTMFSTHYHELTSLEDETNGIKNVHVEVYEKNEEITFLYKVKDGKANRSYGINVAKLAKLPDSVLDRAKQLLNIFEQEGNSKHNNQSQMVVMEKVPTELANIKEMLEYTNPNELTPMEALQLVYEIKDKIKEK